MSEIRVSEIKVTPSPTQYELPCDGVPMETQRHKLQMDMLITRNIHSYTVCRTQFALKVN